MYEVTCLDIDGNTINNFFQWDIDQKIVINVKGYASDYLKIEPEVHFSNSKRDEALVVRSLRTGTISASDAQVRTQPSDSSDLVTTLHSGDKIVYTEYVSDAENVGTAYETSREWCVLEYKNAKRYIKSANITRDMETITASVPNVLLQEPYPLLVYVYLTDSDDVSSQRTVLYTEIPVRKRQKPHDYMYVENITKVTSNLIKDEIEASVKNTREQAINDINSTKSEAINSVTTTKNGTITKITDERDSAVETIETNKTEFIASGNALVSTAQNIKNNTQKTYDDTVVVANNTQKQIETDIDNLITNNGLSLKAVNDGSGNVTFAILVNKS